MNNAFFNKDVFPKNSYEQVKNNSNNYGSIVLPLEQAYILNILRLNNGKQVCVHMIFPNSNDLIDFRGIIENSGSDYIILSEPSTGKWQILPIKYISFITFDENINYSFN